MVASENAILKQAHIDQVVWLGDERAIDLLMRLLDDRDSSVQRMALGILNRIHEFPGRVMFDLPHSAEKYKSLQFDPEFRKMMVGKLPDYLADRTNEGLYL